ncbi:MAG: hypothetical protein K8L91_06150 [Anaerolineae bacterium]|nr:hypothetical protein [Anaerolineae bacterium]
MSDARAKVKISGAVEGLIDREVLQKLIIQMEAEPGDIYDYHGKTKLISKINGHNYAAEYTPWIILIDLDNDASCAPSFVASHLPNQASLMCFRVAVHEIESWLMADTEHLAKFLKVSVGKIPTNPDIVSDPKRVIVDLAQHSNSRDIREDIVPKPKSGRQTGPAYASRMIEFLNHPKYAWRPDIAAKNSDSLARCLRCLKNLVRVVEESQT